VDACGKPRQALDLDNHGPRSKQQNSMYARGYAATREQAMADFKAASEREQ
jgi:hypothetical protein